MEYYQNCICEGDSYKNDCPYTFEQGGGRFHCIGGNLQALKIDSGNESSESWEDDKISTGIAGLADSLKHRSICSIERELKTEARMFNNEVKPLTVNRTHGVSTQKIPQSQNIRDAAQEFMESNRVDLRKFDALQINGQSLNDYSIGGYQIDIAKTAEVVKKLSPLPPSALPKIFTNDDLNFYHHFFKGIEALLSSKSFEEIVNSKFHYDDAKGNLADAIAGFTSSGMLPTDNAVTMFVKKVLSSTFEKATIDEGKSEITVLKVAANLWGFRYIEPHMMLKDVEIRMWLSTCFNHYRTLWFDTFKSSGVPKFAVEGVVHDHSNGVLSWEKVEARTLRQTANLDYLPEGEKYRQVIRSDRRIADKDYEYPRNIRNYRAKTKRSSSWFN